MSENTSGGNKRSIVDIGVLVLAVAGVLTLLAIIFTLANSWIKIGTYTSIHTRIPRQDAIAGARRDIQNKLDRSARLQADEVARRVASMPQSELANKWDKLAGEFQGKNAVLENSSVGRCIFNGPQEENDLIVARLPAGCPPHTNFVVITSAKKIKITAEMYRDGYPVKGVLSFTTSSNPADHSSARCKENTCEVFGMLFWDNPYPGPMELRYKIH